MPGAAHGALVTQVTYNIVGARLIVEKLSDLLFDCRRRVVPRVPLERLAILQKKLLKVPCHVRARHRCPQRHCRTSEACAGKNEHIAVTAAVSLGILLGVLRDRELAAKPLEKRMGVFSVHINLAKNRKGRLESTARAHMFQRVHDLIIILVSLVTKLVAREAIQMGNVHADWWVG